VDRRLRPVDLAREVGLSAQAVRTYERDGVLPAAGRTVGGHRAYTDAHRRALRAFVALVPAHGHAAARGIVRAATAGEVDRALRLVDDGHDRLRRDRATLDAVAVAASVPALDGPLSVGELARRLGVVPATLRAWEVAGVLRPARDRTGQRRYTADDVRDAELAGLLRRGGTGLARIAVVVAQVRDAGGTDELAASLAGWQERLVARGRAMLAGAGALAAHLDGVTDHGDVGRSRP
jgi:DNA-binding transcriptional MerR regulator